MRRQTRGRLILCLALGALSCGAAPAGAGTPGTVSPYAGGSLSLTNENDMWGGTDRYYTNGLQARWTSPAGPPTGAVGWLDRQAGWLLGPGEFRWGLGLSQSIFTPEDIRRRVPDPFDRPYAGHLYGSLTLERATETRRTVLEFQLGLTGPGAGGEFVQNRWHDVINKFHAEGWRYQLRDEPTFGVLTERDWRVALPPVRGIAAEVIPNATLALGNAYTYAGTGALLRLGNALDADWGPVRIRPALSSSPLTRPREEFGWYAFVGVGGRLVARNLFLDGSTFRSGSPSVDRRWAVGEVQFGAALLWRGMRLSYTHVIQSEEFTRQHNGQVFGSLSLTIPF
ncbi:lipid A deacylase LpxR family protein [Roseomonas sp. NAR14]|uniref:Lipid A deacylase LpxR family protein n=1 Tax=Roseomonas acroporae TaxID=2937791 RepID=A0A9X1YBB2_9PROT|nr:lipid A deacylase LpxR family protein [Roseomonas acroporae]MCK8787609.1 lipid A deacylase LpxR family protein [Roseomonas acroporae]